MWLFIFIPSVLFSMFNMEKLKRNESNVFKDVWPFYLTLKYFGMFPLSFNNSGVLMKKKSDRLMPIIAVILMVIVATIVYVSAFSSSLHPDVTLMGWYIW